MPPKGQPGKKGQVDQEDFSDVPTLPPLNSYCFTVLYNSFFSQETREKLQKFIHEKLSADRVKTLTREEIITYGKTKQIILEPNVAATLPQDDPRLKMNESEQIAKAAVDKLFEMSVHARRSKKERLLKLEEEHKVQLQTDPKAQLQTLDPDMLDVMFQINDFPNTKAEANAFAKFNHALHCLFEINQVEKRSEDPEEQEALNSQETRQFQETELAYAQKIADRLNAFLEARKSSTKGTILRNLAVIKLEYTNWPEIDYKLNENGEEIEEKKEPEQLFQADFVQKLEHYGALYIKYLRFKEKVQLLPLAPDKIAIETIKQYQQFEEEYKNWLQEVEHSQSMNQSQRDITDPAQAEEQKQNREQRKKEIEENKGIKQQESEARKKEIQALKEKLKESVDDQLYIKDFKLDVYKSSFPGHKECQNSISSIMSAMVHQIAQENSYHQVFDEFNQTVSTAPETIDDLFTHYDEQINYDVGYYTKVYEQEQLSREEQNYPRQRKFGTEAFAQQQTMIGEVEYFEFQDKQKQPILKLPKQVTNPDEEMAENACLRERNALENLVLPGINRHLMPPVPTKSQRLRDAEKPQLYPFCTLPIEDVERSLILKAFQELLKANFIDEGQTGEKKHAKYKVFERIYQSHLSPEILKQELADAFLSDPDIATLYYPRDDSLLLAIYNKQQSGDRTKVDNSKTWRAAYRVMPDFENWIKYFAEEIIIPNQSQHNTADPKHATQQSLKYQMDEEMIPDTMLDIDDQKVQNIQETTEYLYPPDGSIMKVDTYTVGGNTCKKAMVIKDNLKFGVRAAHYEEDDAPGANGQNGLVKFSKYGPKEFWLNYENDTKLLVEQMIQQRNPQKLIRIDPPKPTPEEIAAREEAIKQAQAAAAKAKGKGGSALANIPVIEEYKEPEPTWEPEPFDYYDNLFEDWKLSEEIIQATTTFPNGLIIKHMGNGNIVQFIHDQAQASEDEVARILLYNSSGTIIRQFKNRDAEIMFSNGVRSYFSKKDMMWTITNNKGLRKACKNGIFWDLDPIPCGCETDSVTNAKMMIREDKVMTIRFKDGSVYCQHADGTVMKTSADQKEIRIEKDGFAPFLIKKGFEQEYKSIKLTPQDRSQTQYIIRTFMPDGTVAITYTDELINDYESGIIHIYQRPDLSCVSVNKNGQIRIISSNTRSAMNERFGKVSMGNDTDYLKALYDYNHQFEDYLAGVYNVYCCSTRCEIYTEDPNRNIKYYIGSELDISKNQIDSNREAIYVDHQNEENMGSEQYDGYEIEDVGGYKESQYKYYVNPRLFVIKNDGSGYELLSKEQLDYFFRIMKNSPESMKQRKVVMIGNTYAKSHYFMTKVKNLSDKELEMTLLKTLEFPQNTKYALLHNKENHPKPHPIDHLTQPDIYLFRQIFEFQELENFKQEAFFDDLSRFKQWRLSQVRYDTEFGIVHVPAKDQVLDYKKIEDDEYMSKRINTKILKERRTKRKLFNPDSLKHQFVLELSNNEEVNEYQRRVTHHLERDESYYKNTTVKDSAEFGGNQYERFGTKGIEVLNSDKVRNIKKKQEVNVQNQLQDIRRMINTPMFMPTYFSSKEGQKFIKVNIITKQNLIQNNPEKPPSQEMLMRMSQRINRSQHNTEKGGQSQFDGHSQRSAHKDGSPGNQNEGQNNQEGDDKESPIVALEPEDFGKQGSAFMGSKRAGNMEGGAQPSLYLQEKIYVQQREQEQVLKSEEYHVVKTKDFNVYGRLRQEKPFVKAIQKSSAQSELNEKFITTECIADRRVKISSMAPRQYINAPSVEDVRKQGQHQMILSAINKKQTFAELINQANAMVTSVLHDPLKRAFNIMPSVLKFGTLSAGQAYELILTVKNEDHIPQRIVVKPLSDKRIQVSQLENDPNPKAKEVGIQQAFGAIAPGITKRISVTIYSNEEGSIKETLQIQTKTDIFKIPIEANILSPDNYQKELQEQQALNGKTLTNSRVRNKLNQSIQRGRMSAHGERNDQQDDYDQFNRGVGGFGLETTNSESKLPVIPNVDRRPFEVDAKKPLKDLIKKSE